MRIEGGGKRERKFSICDFRFAIDKKREDRKGELENGWVVAIL
jgi:hypothetical protein